MDRAHVIASNPPLAIGHLKAALPETLDPDWAELGRWTAATNGALFKTDEHREGVAKPRLAQSTNPRHLERR